MHILLNEKHQAKLRQLSWILKKDVVTSFSLCPSVDVNSVFPLFFCLFVPLLISLSFCICPFYSVLFFCIFLSCSPPPAILPTLIFILRRVLHCCLCDLTTPHLTYFCFILYLGLFIFIYLFVCLLSDISVPVCLVFCVASFYGRTLIILTFSTSNRSS